MKVTAWQWVIVAALMVPALAVAADSLANPAATTNGAATTSTATTSIASGATDTTVLTQAENPKAAQQNKPVAPAKAIRPAVITAVKPAP